MFRSDINASGRETTGLRHVNRRSNLGVLATVVLLACVGCAVTKEGLPEPVGSIDKPILIERSAYLGLSEQEVTERLEETKLRSEGPDLRSFQTRFSSIPPLGGYRYARVNLLTFQNGRVVRHEIVDRINDCVIVAPPRGD